MSIVAPAERDHVSLSCELKRRKACRVALHVEVHLAAPGKAVH